MIKDFAKRFNVYYGVSDHTLGSTVPIIATCLGAKIIEKHFIINRDIGGPDSSFSMDKNEFSDMVKSVREVEKESVKLIIHLLQNAKLKEEVFQDHCTM